MNARIKTVMKAGLLLLLILGSLWLLCACSNAEKELARLTEIIEFKMPESKYTASSYAEYREAYNAAVELYKKENITVIEIDRVVDKVNAAKSKLVAKNDFSELVRQIEIFNSIDPQQYASSSYQLYYEAYERANAVLAVDTSSQSEINAAAEDLDNAKKALRVLPDTSALRRLVAVPVDASLYTGASYAKYKSAVDLANEILAKECPTLEELRHAEIMLSETYSELVLRGNSDALRAKVDHVRNEVLVDDGSGRKAADHFAKTGYYSILRVLSSADKLLTASDASDVEYREMETALDDAVKALVDISSLIDTYDEAGRYAATIARGEYTSASYQRLSAAMEIALRVRNDADAASDEVASAKSALVDAMDRMEHVTISPDGKTDKSIADLTLVIGAAQTTISEYMNDNGAFLGAMFNNGYAFNPSGDAIVFTKHTGGNLRVTLSVDRIFVEYTAKSPVADYDLSSFKLSDTRLDAYVLSLVGEEAFGSPTDYAAGKIVVDGRQKNTATLTYRNDANELTMRIAVNVDDSYILSVEILREALPGLEENP